MVRTVNDTERMAVMSIMVAFSTVIDAESTARETEKRDAQRKDALDAYVEVLKIKTRHPSSTESNSFKAHLGEISRMIRPIDIRQ